MPPITIESSGVTTQWGHPPGLHSHHSQTISFHEYGTMSNRMMVLAIFNTEKSILFSKSCLQQQCVPCSKLQLLTSTSSICKKYACLNLQQNLWDFHSSHMWELTRELKGWNEPYFGDKEVTDARPDYSKVIRAKIEGGKDEKCACLSEDDHSSNAIKLPLVGGTNKNTLLPLGPTKKHQHQHFDRVKPKCQSKLQFCRLRPRLDVKQDILLLPWSVYSP